MYYHQFNFDKFFAQTRFLNNTEISIFLKLQIQYLQDEKPLKDNINLLSRICGASDVETLNVLQLFYELKDGYWCRDQLDEIIADYKSNLDANSRGGKRSAEIRKQKALESNLTSSAVQVTNNQELITNKTEIYKPRNRYQASKPYDVDVSTWESFLSLREKHDAGIFTQNMLNSMSKEAEQLGIDLNTALLICLERDWVYLKAEYLESELPDPFEK
jgi:uncharacterized protein YdaU (DUF1376 family)